LDGMGSVDGFIDRMVGCGDLAEGAGCAPLRGIGTGLDSIVESPMYS
jgi:hypothetical protein